MDTPPDTLVTGDGSPLTRVTLLQRLRSQQDERSWREFVAHYQGYIHRLARRMGLAHHDAEEVVQNVCLKAWKALPTFAYDPSRGRFRGWLWQVAANEAHMLRRGRRREAPMPEESDGEEADIPDPAGRPEEVWIEEEWRAHVTGVAWRNVAGEFEPRTREAFERLSRGESPAVVAAALGLAPASIYVYRKRVQDRLRTEIVRLNELLD